MLRYLIFPEEQQNHSPNPLEDYTLAGTTLLPANFGSIAPINIFLGENNSGKSRFMREIMREKGLVMINILDIEELKFSIEIIYSLIDSAEKLLSVTIKVTQANRHFNFSDPDVKSVLNLLWGTEDIHNLGNKQIDVSLFLSKLKNKLSELTTILKSRDKAIELFSTDQTASIVESIQSSKRDFKYISTLFEEFKSGKLLGKHYDGNNAGIPFRTEHAWIEFDKYNWDRKGWDSVELNKYASACVEISNSVINEIQALINQLNARLDTKTIPEHRTYIPTLRTARTLITKDGTRLESNNDIFQHTTVHDYHLADTGVTVDTGFSLYDAIDTTRNARHDGRNSFKEFELFLSATFFNGKKVDVVAERVRDQRGGNILVAVEGIERDIHDLGDGIQTIIMLLYPLFIAPDKAWFFIEEPEVHLHPGFQRLFIETISTNNILRDKQLTIFLTTHSNHILDFALDDPHHVNIFTFRRREGTGNKSTYQIQLSSQRDIENLTLLGVQNSSVFLANCSIWVEGISDRLYFRAYLTAYLEHLATKENTTVSLLEGLHYTFLEYAGGNISHFDFDAQEGPFTTKTLENVKALSISNRIMLVADQDAGKDTRHQARADQEHGSFKYVVLTSKEVENLLSPALIAKGLKTLFKTRDFDSSLLTQAEYRTKYLGTYLQTKYGSFPNSFLAQSGTIGSSYKRKLAEAIAPNLKWSDMSPTAQDFTKTLYQFIKYHNPRLGSN